MSEFLDDPGIIMSLSLSSHLLSNFSIRPFQNSDDLYTKFCLEDSKLTFGKRNNKLAFLLLSINRLKTDIGACNLIVLNSSVKVCKTYRLCRFKSF